MSDPLGELLEEEGWGLGSPSPESRPLPERAALPVPGPRSLPGATFLRSASPGLDPLLLPVGKDAAPSHHPRDNRGNALGTWELEGSCLVARLGSGVPTFRMRRERPRRPLGLGLVRSHLWARLSSPEPLLEPWPWSGGSLGTVRALPDPLGNCGLQCVCPSPALQLEPGT